VWRPETIAKQALWHEMGRLLRLTVDYIALRVNLKGSNIRLEKLFGICCMKARTAIIKGHN